MGAFANEAVAFSGDATHACALGEDSNFAGRETDASGGGDFAKTISHFFADGLQEFEVIGKRETTIEVDAKSGFSDEVGREFSFAFDAIDLYLRANTVRAGVAFQPGDALFEELAIEFETDASNVPALLGAQ